MNIQHHGFSRFIPVGTALLLLSACATPMMAPEGAQTAREKLTMLQSDAQLANRAPVEIKDAEAAVLAAEVPREDAEQAAHLVLIATNKVEIARARAQSRLYEDQRQALSRESERARLDARTLEVNRARLEAQSARAETADLQRQIEELNARETDRGLVVTLGDLLFATGKSDLSGGAGANLDKLAAFLQEYPDRSVFIEGHTDSVGNSAFNQQLSERRADSVKSYLVGQGVSHGRLSTAGLGEGSPVASNETSTGRQQNRRVEVVIANLSTTSRVD